MKLLAATGLLALAGCSAGASDGADFDVECEGVGLHVNGISGDVSDVSALPVQRYRVSPSQKMVSRILADGQSDKLCLAGGECLVQADRDRVRLSSERNGATLNFFFDSRTGFAYHILRVPLATGKVNLSSWQMSCVERRR